MSEPRYYVKQDEHKQRWIIVNARDPELVWAGSHWAALSHWHLDWATEQAAEHYAESTFGD